MIQWLPEALVLLVGALFLCGLLFAILVGVPLLWLAATGRAGR